MSGVPLPAALSSSSDSGKMVSMMNASVDLILERVLGLVATVLLRSSISMPLPGLHVLLSTRWHPMMNMLIAIVGALLVGVTMEGKFDNGSEDVVLRGSTGGVAGGRHDCFVVGGNRED